MGKSVDNPAAILSKLRQVDVLQSQGTTISDALREIGVSSVTYYRWCKEYGRLQADQLKCLKELEKENERLHRAISILKDRKRAN